MYVHLTTSCFSRVFVFIFWFRIKLRKKMEKGGGTVGPIQKIFRHVGTATSQMLWSIFKYLP